MRSVRVVAAAWAALCLSGVGLTAASVGPVPNTAAGANSHARIWIDHRAEILEQPGYENGTTILVQMTVRCPRGEHGHALFAGLPGYFSDGRFATPYLPGNTMPAVITCTGHRQPLSTVARSVYRLQNPETDPFETFAPSRATAVVGLRMDNGSYYTSSAKIRIVDPRQEPLTQGR